MIIRELETIKFELQKFYVFTGECDEFQITRDSEIGVKLFSMGLNERQFFLDSQNSGLQIIKNEPYGIVVKLQNVIC